MKNKKFVSILLRYLILLIISLPGVDLFYYIFLPLTKYPVFWGLKLFYIPIMLGNSIFMNGKIVEIVGACIGGSAYFLLLVLILSVPLGNLKKRLFILGTSFGMLFTVNAIRIYLLSIMFFEGSSMFDVTHRVFWYFGSTIFVVFIWFFCVYFFRINGIPFFNDLKFIYDRSSLKKENRDNIDLGLKKGQRAKKRK